MMGSEQASPQTNKIETANQKLSGVLQRRHPEIAAAWADQIRLLPDAHFHTFSDAELFNLTSSGLDAILSMLQNRSNATLEAFFHSAEFINFQRHHDPKEVTRALWLCKKAVQTFLVQMYPQDAAAVLEMNTTLEDHLQQLIELNARLSKSQGDESLETFQNLMVLMLKMFQERTVSLSNDELLSFIADELMEAIPFIECLTYRVDPVKNLLILKTENERFAHYSPELQTWIKLPLDPEKDPFIQQILEHKSIVFAEDAQTDPRTNQRMAQVLKMKSFIGIPFVVHEQVLSVMLVCTFQDNQPFTPEHLAVLQNLSSTASLMIENILLHKESGQRLAENQGLERITSALLQELDTEEVLRIVCAEAQRLTNASESFVFFAAKEDDLLHLVFNTGAKPPFDVLPFYSSIAGDAIREDRSIFINDASADSRFQHLRGFLKNVLAAPLIANGVAIGALYLVDKPGGFTEDEARIIRIFADQAAVAIENARLREHVRRIAALEERERLAREIHDNVAQVLSTLKLQASFANDLLHSGQIPQAQAALAELNKTASEAHADIREAIFSLRNNAASNLEFLPTLQSYLDRYRKSYGIDVQFSANEADRLSLSPNAAIQLPRIIQEALINVRKHAHASSVAITLEQNQDTLCVVIQDNGQGFNPSEAQEKSLSGVGLQVMRERAESIGGMFQIQSQPGQGTRITIQIPAPAVSQRE
jgi:signal transduction histidine kinase/phosphopantetheinyl transferase (holo-ACP synthase)